jgi:Tol biopolymer transport system component
MSSDRKLVSATLILISAAILTLLWWSVGKTSLIPPDANPVQLTSYPGTEYTPSLSPNGEYVAFSWNGEESDNLDIYVQVIGTAEPQPLTTDPAEDSWPTWSSEGTQVAYLRWVSDREFSVHVRPLLGGTEIRVTEATITGISELVGFDYFKLSWSPSLTKSEIAMVEQCSPTADCVVLLDIESRKKRQLTSPPTDSWDGVPTFSPDGEMVAFVRYSQYGTRAELCVQRALSGDARCHAAPALIWDLDWTPDGSTVVAALWDPGGAWDRNGLWAVSVSKGSFSRLPFGNDARNVSIARLGGRLVYRESLYNDDLWRLSGPNASESGPPARFQVSSTRSDHLPLYSPDGSKVVFLSVRGGEKQVWVCDSDGYRPRRLNRKSALPGGWSPDSEQIVFSTFPGEENSDIFVMGVTGGVLQRLTSDEFFDGFASWSPDGRSIYYDSLREGTGQIFKVPVEGGTPIQLTKAGGLNPQPHGSNVFYWWEGRIWAIPPDGGEEVLILDQSVDSTNWCIWNGKIVYMTPGEEGYSIELFDPANGETAAIGKAGDVVEPFAGLTVSPDGQWILYSKAVVRTADLMLVENFHR